MAFSGLFEHALYVPDGEGEAVEEDEHGDGGENAEAEEDGGGADAVADNAEGVAFGFAGAVFVYAAAGGASRQMAAGTRKKAGRGRNKRLRCFGGMRYEGAGAYWFAQEIRQFGDSGAGDAGGAASGDGAGDGAPYGA